MIADQRIEVSLLERGASHPDRIAVEDLDRTATYRQLVHGASAIAGTLDDLGLKRGDRVAVFLDKNLESVTSMFGIWLAGGVVVPIAPTLKPAQVRYILEHSGSARCVSTPSKLRRSQVELSANVQCVAPPPLDVNANPRPLLTPITDELALLQYTSGSTGMPKGVAISHENLCAGSRIVTSYLGLRADDRILSVLPFSFDYGMNQLLTSIRVGATLVLQRSMLAVDIARSLEQRQITVMAGVPTVWMQLLDTGLVQKERMPRLRIMTNSGGALPIDVVAQARRSLPECRVFLMYGLTEAFRSTYLPPEEIERRPGSMGKAIPETEIFVVDERDQIVRPQEIGELVHRGPTVALGYWNDLDATRERYRVDPFDPGAKRPVVYSGDLVRKDEDGYLYFVGRRDEMIKAYGYRVSPTEVEAIVLQSELVREVVVASVPDPIAGARIVVHCVPGPKFTEAALLEHCQREMPNYMVPARIDVHESFPRTSSGKIDRAQIKRHGR